MALAETKTLTTQQGSGEPGVGIEVFAAAKGTANCLIDLLSDSEIFPGKKINKMMGRLEQFLKTSPFVYAIEVSSDPLLEYPNYELVDDRRGQHTLVLPQNFGILLMDPEGDNIKKYHLVYQFVRAASFTRNQDKREDFTNARLEELENIIEEDFTVFEELMNRLLGVDEEESLEIEAFLPEEEPRQLSFFEDFSAE